MVIPEDGHLNVDRRHYCNRIALNRITLGCWLDTPNVRRRFGKRGTKGPTPARHQRSPTSHPAWKLPARSGFYTQHWRPAWTYATADWRQTKSRPYQASDKKQYRRSTVAPRQTPSQ